MLTVDALVKAAQQKRLEPKKNCDGHWAFCPVCDPRKAGAMGLSLKVDDNGQGTVWCFNGCDPDQILFELGIGPARASTSAPPSSSTNSGTSHPPSSAAATGAKPLDFKTLSDETLGIIRARDVQERPIDWLWVYRLAVGEMALLAGDGGLGKSSLLLAIAALITRGGEWWDKSGRAPIGDVIIVSAEDSRETTLKPRLMALGADLDRIKFVTARMTIVKAGQPPMVNPMTLQDLAYWREVLRRFPTCKLLIVDPVPSYLGRGVNDAKNNELRSVIEPFIETVIRPAGVCFAANTHLNKNIDSKTPMHRITGSMAYGNLPRNVHFVVADPDKPDRMFFKQAKCNNAPRDLSAIAYSLIRADIPCANGTIETTLPVFEAETVQVDDLQAAMGSRRGKPGPAPEKTVKVAVWLLAYLRSHPGPSLMREVFDAAGAMDYVGVQKANESGYLRWSIPGTLYRAKDEISKLPSPDDGWMVEDSKVGKLVYWEAVRS
jgi:AAA domain